MEAYPGPACVPAVGLILLLVVVLAAVVVLSLKRSWLLAAVPIVCLIVLMLSLGLPMWAPLVAGVGAVIVVYMGMRQPLNQQDKATGPVPRGARPVHALAMVRGGKDPEAPAADPGCCPACGAELSADSPEGLCPRCLLECGLSGAEPSTPAGGKTGTGPHLPPGGIPDPADLAPLFPHLEILELLGQGGMGAVYKARQVKLDRLVAVKVLPPEWGKDPAFAERFAREARALARLSHPHIVAVHDFGEAGGLYYLIMEYVDGVNLRQLLQADQLSPEQALRIVPQICDALDYAHGEGIVHRDIKPENILLDKKGRVKIADFGLAKLVGAPRKEWTLTGSHQVMGTLDYMAPEQRLRPLEVDHRADIYSLGVVFYEMLTGELPLGRFAAPSQLAPMDARLDEVVFRALEREPERRYQRISEVKADLEGLAAGSPPPAATPLEPGTGPEAEAISIPFKMGDEWGAWDYHGLARFDGSALVLEYDEGIFRSRVVEKSLPLRDIQSVSLTHGWLSTVLTVRVSRLSVLAGIPNGSKGEVYLYFSGKDAEAAEQLVSAIRRRLPRGLSRLALGAEQAAALGALDPETVRRQLRGPAVALAASGFAGYLWWLGMSLVKGGSPGSVFVQPQFWMAVGSGLLAVFIAVAASQMARLRWYGLAFLAIVLAMLPWSLNCVIGIPAGIWALLVLRRAEVRAAFALSVRRGTSAPGGPILPAGDRLPDQLTGPIRRRVRSFLRSVRSMFISSPDVADSGSWEGAAVSSEPQAISFSEPAYRPEPAGKATPVARPRRTDRDLATPEGRRRSWLLVIVLLVVLLAVCLLPCLGMGLYFLSIHTGESRSAQPVAALARLGPLPAAGEWIDEPEGPPAVLAAMGEFGLNGLEPARVRRVLEDAYQNYLVIEAKHTDQHVDGAGHVVVTIAPFQDELAKLNRRVWQQLGRNLNEQQRVLARPFNGSLFPYGWAEWRIEMWHEGVDYHWNVSNPEGRPNANTLGSGPRLPKKYERFWLQPERNGKNGGPAL